MKAHFLMATALMLGACSPEPAAPPAPDAPSLVEALDVAEDAVQPAPSEPAAPVSVAAAPPVLAHPACAQAALVSAEPAQPSVATQRNPGMVGIRVNENIINSGGGNFASNTTVMTTELYPDGRVVQHTESIGGGGDWSNDGGRTIDFDGQWRADGKNPYVYASPLPDFTPAATYSFSSDYLVTQSDMGRLIWQRRG